LPSICHTCPCQRNMRLPDEGYGNFFLFFFPILWCSLGGVHIYVGLVKFHYSQNMKGNFSSILVYLLVPTWTIYRKLTISKKNICDGKKSWWFLFIIEFATKISIICCNSVKFCTHKKAIWEEHFMWLFSIHKLM